MIASFTCELCMREFDDDSDFISCRGDVCGEVVCKGCAHKCKDPKCHHYICDNCFRYSQSKEYLGPYCIDHAMWSTKKDGDWKNFDYVSKGLTHKQGLKFLKLKGSR